MFMEMLKQHVQRWRKFKKRQQKIPDWWGLQDVTEEWRTWRDQIPADAKPYWSYKEELTMMNGILFKVKIDRYQHQWEKKF